MLPNWLKDPFKTFEGEKVIKICDGNDGWKAIRDNPYYSSDARKKEYADKVWRIRIEKLKSCGYDGDVSKLDKIKTNELEEHLGRK